MTLILGLNSVVAVHGLYGDRENTWTTDGKNNAPGSSWLKDKIHEHYPASRVLSVGYGANDTMAGIREMALRLLDGLVEQRESLNPVCTMSYCQGRPIADLLKLEPLWSSNIYRS